MGIPPIGNISKAQLINRLMSDTSYDVTKSFKNLELRETPFFKYLADSNSHVRGIKMGEGKVILRSGQIDGQNYTSLIMPNKKSTSFIIDDAFAEKILPASNDNAVRNFRLQGEKKDGKIINLSTCGFNERIGDIPISECTNLNAKNLESILKQVKEEGIQMHNLTKVYINKAIEFLREKGLATAEKKAGRVAAEGLVKVIVSDDKKKAVAVEVNAETDFVAKNEKFQAYVAQVAEQAMETEAADIDAFLAETWKFDETKTVNEALAGQIAIIGENMNIRRFQQVKEDAGFVASYTHMGGKIGVLVDVATDVVNADIEEMAKNVCMQVAALNPKYTDRSEVDQDYLAKEEEILTAAAKNEKPDANDKIITGMVKGRLNKELKEICLMDQVYVKAEDGKQSVSKYVEEVAKANNAKIAIKGFVRMETGEGIEKKEEDFAAEVAAQMAGK